MKKTFAISALTLAIASVNVSANTGQPQDCVSEGGQGESLAEWGIWCGVGSFLGALSEMDPSAAGPGDTGFDVDVTDPTGRGESDGFEPDVATGEDVDLHIQQPQGGPLNGYHVSFDSTYEYEYQDEGYGDGYGDFFVEDIEGYGGGYGDVNQQVGGFSLGVEDGGYGYGEGYGDRGYGEDTVDYARYDADGNLIGGESGSSFDNGSYYTGDEDQNESGYQYTYVNEYEEDDRSSNFYHYGYNNKSTYEGDSYSYDNDYRDVSGSEVWVYNEGEGESLDGPQPRFIGPEERRLLKGYWAGYVYSSVSQSDDVGESGENMNGMFLAGTFTALSEIQDKISGDVSAVYTGNSHYWNQSVRLDVDFGEQSFTAEFGDVEDYCCKRGPQGQSYDQDMSFTAAGVIDGVHLISTEVSADEGFVQGSFFGESGDIVGGAYDVTIGDDRLTDIYTAVEGEGNRVSNGGGPT